MAGIYKIGKKNVMYCFDRAKPAGNVRKQKILSKDALCVVS
jgi:hypothetical protein